MGRLAGMPAHTVKKGNLRVFRLSDSRHVLPCSHVLMHLVCIAHFWAPPTLSLLALKPLLPGLPAMWRLHCLVCVIGDTFVITFCPFIC